MFIKNNLFGFITLIEAGREKFILREKERKCVLLKKNVKVVTMLLNKNGHYFKKIIKKLEMIYAN